MNALSSIYPESRWLPWRFSSTRPQITCWDGKYDSDFLNDITKQLRISKLDNWYRISREDLSKCHAETFLKKRGGLVTFLSKSYPHHKWDREKFSNRQKKSSQWILYKIIKEVLPSDIEVIEDYTHPFLVFETGCVITFDIYISSLNVAIEYNGYQHYHDHVMFGDALSNKKRDNERRTACKSSGISLIEVPYWWQRDKANIRYMSTICLQLYKSLH